VGTSVVAWRTDQTKGGFAIVSQMACQNGSSRSQESDVIKQRIPLDRLDMGPSMDPFDVPLKSGFRLDELEFCLEDLTMASILPSAAAGS